MNALNLPKVGSSQMTSIVRHICERLEIAFEPNRLFPSLADINDKGDAFSDTEKLNLIGQNFGLRFRELSGTHRELTTAVQNAGPALIGFDSDSPLLVLDSPDGKNFTIYFNGEDKSVSAKQLKSILAEQGVSGELSWFLAQPMLVADGASRFHYQSGKMGSALSPLRRYWSMLKPEISDLKAIFVFSLVIGLLSLTTPLAVEAIVTTIAFGKYIQPLIMLSLMVLVFLGFLASLNVLMAIVSEVVQRKLFVRTVEDLAYRLTRVPLTTWKKYHGPELVNRFFDIANVQKITSKLLLDSLMLALQTLIGLTVLAFYHPFLLGYDVGLLVMMTVVLWFIGRGAVGSAIDESQVKYETAAWLQEIVRHPSTFKFNGGLSYALNRADTLVSKYIQVRQTHFKTLLRQISFAVVMQVVAATTLLALGGYLVMSGQMTLGQLVAAELIVAVILGSFAKLGKDLESFYDLMASVDKLGKLFDLPVEQFDKLQLARRPGAYNVSLVDVKLEKTDPACSFDLNAGGTFAIYGSNELRRTLLMEAFVGQAKPSSGHFLLDNFRVDALSAESLQSKISFIHEIEIFEGTVDDNIRLSRENVGSRQMNAVVGQLGLQETISSLPQGYATKLSICGFPLSQGEAIRLTVARALIAKPAVLFLNGILDRLSDVDTEDVLTKLSPLTTETTIIVATGRKAIAQWAEKCLNLDDKHWQLKKFSSDGINPNGSGA